LVSSLLGFHLLVCLFGPVGLVALVGFVFVVGVFGLLSENHCRSILAEDFESNPKKSSQSSDQSKLNDFALGVANILVKTFVLFECESEQHHEMKLESISTARSTH
jgi:hypothetical protein